MVQRDGKHWVTGPHTANSTSSRSLRYDCQVTYHPTHSPDLASSNFHLLGPLKKHLASMRFATDADVKQAVTSWLQTTDTDLPTPGYMPRCQGGTNSYVNGDHVEVKYVLSTTQVPCVRCVILETALYKLQYPHEQQAKLQKFQSVLSWCFVIYIAVSQVHIIWIKQLICIYHVITCWRIQYNQDRTREAIAINRCFKKSTPHGGERTSQFHQWRVVQP
jgi:hypothetical protein